MRTIIAGFCVIGLTLSVSIEHSFANPVGGSVVGGDANATIAGQGTALTTINQSANQVIINWQNFSIGAGEMTRFVQPSATAAALNRVTSGNPSQIYGSLQANGRVFVINPNGILVGPSGQIDTKGFVASTLDVPDASFLSGANLILSGNSTASVRNEGTIQALGGDVYLIAHSVENDGTINAPQGTVGLAAGSQIQLVQSGDQRLSVLAGNPSAPATAVGVNNSGTVQAASVELKAAGGNIYALAINNGGIVRATGIVNKNGHIYLAAAGGNIQNSGTLAANNADGSGGTIVVDGGHNAFAPATVINGGTIEARGDAAGTMGGTVEILGDNVGLFDDAVVDVSGDSGGGTALIGGDLHGANLSVPNAAATYVSPGAVIRADALSAGNGGKAVVWSDDTTRFYGSVSARGGANGGDGGHIEVSGRQYLDFQGMASTLAPLGVVGTLLLDPTDLTIDNTGSDTGINGSSPFVPSASPSHLLWSTIAGALTGGDVLVTTVGSPASGAETGRITVGADSGDLASANQLTLNAVGNLILNGAILNTVGGGLNLTSAGTIAINNNLTASTLTVHSGSSGVGNITFANGVTVNADSQTFQAGSGSASAASVNFVIGSGPANNTRFRGVAGGATSPNTFVIEQDASIADADIPAAAQFGGSVPGTYTVRSDGGNLNLSVGGTAADFAGSVLTLFANGTLTIDASFSGGNTLASLDATGSGITLGSGGGITIATTGGQTYNGPVTLGTGATLNGTTLDLAGVTGGNHNLTLGNSGAATLNGAVSGVNQLTASGAGTLAVNNAISASSVNDSEATTLSGGTVTTTAGQTYSDAVTLGADTTLNGTTLSLAGVTGGGFGLTLDNSGAATLNGAVSGVNQLAASGSGTLTVNNTAPISATSVNDGEATTLSGGTVTTTAGQSYTGPVTLGANATLDGTTLDLAGVTGGNHNLTLGNSGAATLNGAVSGVNQLTASGAGTLSVNNAISATSVNDSEATTLSGSTVTTSAGQSYTGPVTLGGNATLDGTTLDLAGVTGGNHNLTLGNSGAATLNGAVSGVNQLTASGAGTLAVNNAISASSVNDSEATTLSGGTVTTTAGQTYSDAVTLGADTTLNGTTLSLAGVTGGGFGLTLDNSGAATLNGAVSGVNQLAASGSGTLTVNNTAPISATSVNDGEATTLSGGTVTTTAGQSYTGPVTLGANATLDGTTLDLAGVTGGNHNLTLGNSGAATLNGTVSGVNQLTASGAGTLSVNNAISASSVNDSEATTLSGSTVTTTGGQTYNNPVTLGANVTLSSSGNGNISLNSTVDADNAANNRTLQVNTGGTATFGNSVGAVNALGGLTVNAGTISLNGAVTVNSLGTVDMESPGNIAINVGITAGTLTVHSGTDGTGNISFGPSIVTIDANSQSYQAGDGTGDGATATANLIGSGPVFNNYSGSGAPASFTFRQDAPITAGEVPIIAPATYTIESDDGSVQLPGLNLPGDLNVHAGDAITQSGPLTVGGTATFATDPVSDITLADPANDFNNIVITSGQDVTVKDMNNITFGPQGSTIAGNLTVMTGDTGNINFSGTPTTSVGGNFTIDAGGDLNGTYIVGGTVSITVGGQNNGSLSRFLSGLSQVEIPVPRPETTTFSAASISVDQAAKILPPGAIGTLWLQIPFPHVKEKNYRIEDVSKWTSGPIAAAGSTSGPQVPK